jgi:phytoene dehydrogenase-like protein
MSDAIVIGAGPNGLAAAIRLAEAGRSVVVLEAADHYGGAVRTEELTLPGFHHDTFSSVYPAAAASPVFERMPLAEHGLEWVHPAACYATPLPDGVPAPALYRSMQQTVASLDAVRAGDGAAWERFATPLLGAWDALRATMLSGFPPVGGPLKLLTQAGPIGTLKFTRLLAESSVGLARRLFESGDSAVAAGRGGAAGGRARGLPDVAGRRGPHRRARGAADRLRRPCRRRRHRRWGGGPRRDRRRRRDAPRAGGDGRRRPARLVRRDVEAL